MKKQIITLAVTGLLLSGCGIYTKYEPVTSVPDQLYGGAGHCEQLRYA